jgi:hypothetical protein
MGHLARGASVNRAALEHIIRAAAAIAEDEEIVVIGSQAVLGQYPDAPSELLVSVEADVYPLHHPARAELIDGSIGELSMFHETFGYYAQGVGPETATLPAGWQSRLVPVKTPNTRGATGWCLEIHDLLLSKYVAGREKDEEFCRVAAEHRLAERAILEERAAHMELESPIRARLMSRIARDFGAPKKT